MNQPKFPKGSKVTMAGYDKQGHVFCGIVATVIDNRQFQNASNDDWTWSALIEYEFLGETVNNFYPEKYLSPKRQIT